ncbi:hypothetical protein [Pseudomonas syringae]|uniref:hypothetical protein n=1 Tax=Pseudomonas syringae TaxID=317 RepID=UPI00073196D8|nr:hypothetical protein [Pseudomonas syringae]KTB99750.1 hypothetical protein AO386_05680 [Pseudomonas syringae ICMP 11292]
MAVKSVTNRDQSFANSDVTVLIYERNKDARVDWDYFRLPEVNDQFLKDHAPELMEIVQGCYFSCAQKKSEFQGNGLVGHIDGILLDDARRVAQEISDMFDAYVQKRINAA